MDIVALVREGRQAEVVADLRPKSDAGDASASNNLALVHRWLGDQVQEVAFALRAFQQDPSSPQGINTLFRALAGAGHFQTLTAIYAALPNKRRLVRHQKLLAMLAYRECNRLAQAQEIFDDLTDFPQENIVELDIAVRLAHAMSDHPSALSLIDRLEAAGAHVHVLRLSELFGSGDMAGALKVYEDNWRSDPVLATNTHAALACAIALGDRETVVRLAPRMVGSAREVARCYLEGVRDVLVRGAVRSYRFPFEPNNLSIALRHAKGEFYEVKSLQSLAPQVSPGDQVVDVGANIGNHTVFFAGELGCRVTPFECNPNLTPLLRRSVADSDLGSLVDLSHVGKAITDGPGEVFFNHIRADYSNVSRRSDGALTSVPSMALDSLELPSCRLLKVDVDGGEIGVLRGAEAFLARHRPLLVIEVMNFNIAEALSLIDKAGYAMVRENARAKTHSDFVFSPAEQEPPLL
ncbi:FkbM family methyltransferase [Phenylobacterium sp.]|uniref:FkbM family methyltransferase n=1 Tax=Phenylobacterium sp. TaxID=1871053 RepID=UPI0030F43E83